MFFSFAQTAIFLIAVFAADTFLSNATTCNDTSLSYPKSVTLLPTPSIPGCRVNNEGTIYSVFCTKFYDNTSSSSLPLETKRLQIYWVTNLSIYTPLCDHLQFLEILELSANRLKDVSKEMFMGLTNLQVINMSDNHIRYLPVDVFIYNQFLKSIDLSKNLFHGFIYATRAMIGLPFLERLYLSDNIILEFITLAGFMPLNSSDLKVLDLSVCYITHIEKDAFLPIKNLTHLNLSDNPLSQIALLNLSSCFENNQSLRNLIDLRMKKIRFLPLSFFRALNGSNIENLEIADNVYLQFFFLNYYYPKLQALDVSSCCTIFDGHQFNTSNNLPSLTVLILNRVGFSEIKEEFLFLPGLKKLILSGNLKGFPDRISMSERAFQNLHSLDKFHLSGMNIEQPLSRSIFHGLENLKELEMLYTSIKVIEDFSFRSLKNLELLDLSGNKIEILRNNTFYGLRNLKRLLLTGNSIVFFNSTHPFQHLHHLQNLNMVGNRLIQLPAGIFVDLHSIVIIRLNDNFIVPWQEHIFLRHENITIFTITSNSLSHFTPAMLEDVKQMQYLDFSKNPFNCSYCETLELQIWLNEHNCPIVKDLKLNDTGYYDCRYPKELEGQPIITVDLSYNSHCFPVYIDILQILYCTFCPVIGFVVFVTVVWYKWKWDIRYFCFHVQLGVKRYKEQQYADNYEFDAFISYCDIDYVWVKDHLVPELETKDPKFRLCLPDRDVVAGNTFADIIPTVIKRSRATVLVLSNNAMESHWSKFDLDMAQHQLFEETRSGLILIMLQKIEKTLVNKNLKYILRTRTVLQFPDNPVGQKLFWERLRFAISRPEEKIVFKHIT